MTKNAHELNYLKAAEEPPKIEHELCETVGK